MLTSMRELLFKARKCGYAVSAFDVADLAFVRAVVEEAERWRSPAILMVLAQDAGTTLPLLAALARIAARHTAVPLTLHLDHGCSLEECRGAIANGFTGVMIDGAELSFEENVALTHVVVRIARVRDVAVEAEISCSCEVPLVLHGGSGTPVDQLRDAVALGVAKVKFYTELAQAHVQGFRQLADDVSQSVPLPGDLCALPLEAMRCVVRDKMAACNSAGKA